MELSKTLLSFHAPSEISTKSVAAFRNNTGLDKQKFSA